MSIRVRSLWRNLRHRARLERKLDDELRATFDVLLDEHLAGGLPEPQARRAAALELQIGPVKERVRDVKAGVAMDEPDELARLTLAMLVLRASEAGMSTKTALGETEHHVLLAAVRLGAEADTVAIVRELEAQTGRRVAPAAVYIALRRLEAHRLVRSQLVTRRGESRTRRRFEVTPAGRTLLRASRERLLNLWAGLDPLWKGR